MIRPAVPILLAAALALGWTAPGHAEDGWPVLDKPTRPAKPADKKDTLVPAKVFLSEDGQTVYIIGMIVDGTFHDFDGVLQKAPRARTVYLASGGGYTLEARLIAAMVRKRGLNTYVEFYCASACTQVFAAGKERVLGPTARMGFHQAVRIDSRGRPIGVRAKTDRKLTPTTVFGVNGNDTLRLAYELAGTDPAFIEKALNQSPDGMWLPTRNEVLAARMATRLATTSEVAAPPGGGGTREEVRARMLKEPLWRAVLARKPDLAEAVFEDTYFLVNSGIEWTEAVATGRGRAVKLAMQRLARSPDPVLEQALTYYALSARYQRERGWPACAAMVGKPSKPLVAEDYEMLAQEDALMVTILDTEEQVPAMDGEAATKVFSKDVAPTLVPAYKASLRAGTEGKCRLGLQTFEVVGALPAKKRIKAYRAVLSLPGMATAD
ncbi:MAG TPA: hypothetical protein VFV30_13075 [Novosphingobium sp.]|nr:hypothetical protein [Novosphingobium sp.]